MDENTYRSESASAWRNRSLLYMMKENGSFSDEGDILEHLEFYFQCCSIREDCESMSVIAATLANGGVCPMTGDEIFKSEHVQHALSLMGTCGMYDYR